MAFKTAGDEQNGPSGNSNGFVWRNLNEGCCPSCGEELVDFKHLNLYKCRCGFKIGYERMRQMLDNLSDEEDSFPSSGFAIGSYDDEEPF